MHTFTIATGKTTLTLCLTEDGRFVRTRLSGAGYTFAGESEEFFLTWNGAYLSGSTPGWQFAGESHSTGTQGEELTVIALEREGLRVERSYIAYPGQSAIGSHTAYVNLTDGEAAVSDPSILILRDGDAAAAYGCMTGGANFTGSLQYKEIPLTEGYSRLFDSHGEPEITEVEGVTRDSRHPVPNGTGIWCELYALCGEAGRAWVCFDYQGWWHARVTRTDGVTALKVWCRLNVWTLAPGERMELPNVTVGCAAGDVDDMGNDINSYIYAYKWDYTREPYFMEATTTIWREAPLTEKVWHLTREAQRIGSWQIHVDDFWFDAKGSWEAVFGDDWGRFNSYLKRMGMDFRLWMPPWHADRLSKVWLEHPDWMLNFHGNWYNWTIDLSKEEAYQWVLEMLCRKQQQFGTYMLRVDGNPTCLRNDGGFTTEGGNYDPAFKQSENFYRLYKEFKDRNPEAGLNGCSSGGHTLTIEAVRYTDTQQITDGECRHYGGYWATLFNPIDKIGGLGGGSMNLNPETQPLTQEQILEKRSSAVFARWGRKVGLGGRGVLVYRPEVQIGDKTFFVERLSSDRRRGMITLSGGKNPFAGKPETVYPKGLLPELDYTVESKNASFAPITKTGAEWMAQGIHIPAFTAGDSLYLNLTDRPGMGTDTSVPTAPGRVTVTQECWLNRQGAMVTWEPSQDEGVIAYYALYKNNRLLAEVAAGLGWLDETYRQGDTYAVCAVDGDGNKSEFVTGDPSL